MSEDRTYAISWREGETLRVVGTLALARRNLRVIGRAGDARESTRIVRYRDIETVATIRFDGNRLLELALRDGMHVRIATLDGAGSLTELARELHERAESVDGARPRIAD